MIQRIALAVALLVAAGCHKEERLHRPVPISTTPPPRANGRPPLTDSNMNPCALSYSYPIKKWVGKGKKRHLVDTGKRALVGVTKDLRAAGIEVADGSPDRGGIHLMRFKSIEDGITACNFVLARSYADRTIPRAIRKWCGGKSQASYVKFVLDRTGIDRERTIKNMNKKERSLLVAAMAHWEGGQCTAVAQATQEALNVRVLECRSPGQKSPLDGGLARR